jgi:hypothetical protein
MLLDNIFEGEDGYGRLVKRMWRQGEWVKFLGRILGGLDKDTWGLI